MRLRISGVIDNVYTKPGFLDRSTGETSQTKYYAQMLSVDANGKRVLQDIRVNDPMEAKKFESKNVSMEVNVYPWALNNNPENLNVAFGQKKDTSIKLIQSQSKAA